MSGAQIPYNRPVAGKRISKKKPPEAPGRDDRGKRLLDLVVLLLGARSPVPFREIRAQFRAYKTENEEAGLRAFERDKVDLLELGVPLRYVTPEDDDSVDEAGYVVDLRRYRLPEIHLLPDEVSALVLAGSVARAAVGTTYEEVVDLALKKLAFDSPDAPDTPPGKRVREPVIVHFPRTAQVTAMAERLALLELATRCKKRLTMSYVSASSGKSAQREIDPYGLVYRQGAWLLVGYCHLREGVRSFRIDRMSDVAMGPKPKSPDFERPTGFDVRRYADRSPWTFETETPTEVELEIGPSASAITHEDFGDGVDIDTTPLAGGATRLRFSCGNPDYLISRVIAAKGALRVLSPASMKARVKDELAAVAEKYGK